MPAGNMAPQKVHFYLDPILWTGLSVEVVKRRLQLVIDACNDVWKKNTSLRWELGNVNFDVNACPKSNSPVGGPAEGFPYHVQLVAGGRGSFLYATDGGVCAWNLRCAGLTDDRTSVQFIQLVNDILHEYGHLVQGEGYFCITFKDLDGAAPTLPTVDIRYGTPESLSYWRTDARRKLYIHDPMVRTSQLADIRWCPVNAAQLDRPQNKWLDLPSALRFRVTLNGKPVKGAKFVLFDCEYTGMAEEAKLYHRDVTDELGRVYAHFDYDDGGLPLDNITDRGARYRMYKVYYEGYSAGNYLSVIDLWEAAALGQEIVDVELELNPAGVVTPPTTGGWGEVVVVNPPTTGTSDLTKADVAAIESELKACSAVMSKAAVELKKIATRL